MRIVSFFFALFVTLSLSAQTTIVKSLEQDVPGQGKVTVHQSEDISELLGARQHVVPKSPQHSQPASSSAQNASSAQETSKSPKAPADSSSPKINVAEDGTITLEDDEKEETPRTIVKMAGYRVQVYAGNNTRKAKNEATHVASSVHENFPDVPIYTFFYSPRWLCRVGDFRSMEEAYSMLHKLKSTGKFHEATIVKDRVNVKL